MAVLKKKTKKRGGSSYYGFPMTLTLVFTFLFVFALLWSLFISGPARVHDEQLAKAYVTIEKKVPGYTEDTLYWFDQKLDEITTRDIGTLDYEKAREIAQKEYGIEPSTVELTFGYNSPCYEVIGSDRMLLLDYDTFTRVYERQV